MNYDEAGEFAKTFVNGTPFAEHVSAWEYIAEMVKGASDWKEAQGICHDYGMTTDRHITAELAEAFELNEELMHDIEAFFGMNARIDKALDAFLPIGNPKVKVWGEGYQKQLEAIRAEFS